MRRRMIPPLKAASDSAERAIARMRVPTISRLVFGPEPMLAIPTPCVDEKGRVYVAERILIWAA